MKVIVISHLWPRSQAPHLGVFVAEQVVALSKLCDLSVVVPIDRTFRREEVKFREVVKGFPEFRRRTHPELATVPGIALSTVSYRSPLRREGHELNAAQRLADSLRTVDIKGVDLIHAHTLFPDAIAASLWLRDKSIPLAVTAHGSDVHSVRPGVLKILPRSLERADAIIPVSGFLRERLISFGANSEKLHVIPNGFPADHFSAPITVERDPNKIAFLGRLTDIKRIDLLIRALALLDAKITLQIAGDGPLRKKLEMLVNNLGLTKRVTFLGMLGRDQIPTFLSSVALLVLVSQREGWPTVVFESFACGTPVLATSVGGLPEAIASPNLGVLVPEDVTPRRLAAELRTALQRNWDRQTIRLYAREYAWDKIAVRTFELYRQIIY
ncbi:MAG: glycosyltransferase [bacterium]|nr:glycosyltransferase [bacterium]